MAMCSPDRWRGALDDLEMVALWLCEIVIADLAQCTALAGVLHAGPDEGGVEIVAAIGENRPGCDAAPQSCHLVEVLGPDRSREPVRAVVHECHGFFVVGDLHDP